MKEKEGETGHTKKFLCLAQAPVYNVDEMRQAYAQSTARRVKEKVRERRARAKGVRGRKKCHELSFKLSSRLVMCVREKSKKQRKVHERERERERIQVCESQFW